MIRHKELRRTKNDGEKNDCKKQKKTQRKQRIESPFLRSRKYCIGEKETPVQSLQSKTNKQTTIKKKEIFSFFVETHRKSRAAIFFSITEKKKTWASIIFF